MGASTCATTRSTTAHAQIFELNRRRTFSTVKLQLRIAGNPSNGGNGSMTWSQSQRVERMKLPICCKTLHQGLVTAQSSLTKSMRREYLCAKLVDCLCCASP